MNRYLTIAILAGATGLVGASAGCDNDAKRKQDGPGRSEPDNTRVNERDMDPGAVLPLDQSETPTDRAITQKIRQAVVSDDQLSMDAKNVKITTTNGVVTLRGPVDTANERDIVGRFAQGVSDVNRVDNQLEIQEGAVAP